MQKLLQGHLDQRSPGEAAGPVAGSDDVERRERRVHRRDVETIFGTVQVDRVGYARPGEDSSPSARCVAQPAGGAVLAGGAPSGGGGGGVAVVPTKRCWICPAVLGRRCRSVRRNSWRLARRRTSTRSTRRGVAAAGEPAPDESVVVLTFDGKGVVLHREDLREATRREAERRRRQREQLSRSTASSRGEKKHLEADGDGGRRLHGEYERNHARRYADGIVPPAAEPPPPPSSPRLRRVK